jgi:hypothetical protein
MKNLKILGADHLAYMEELAIGNIYRILISKRLLLRPLFPMWGIFFALFFTGNSTLFAMVGIPIMIVYSVFLVNLYPYWHACNISVRAYAFFHAESILFLLILSFFTSKLSEVIYEFLVL